MGLFDSMLVGAVGAAAGGRADDLREQQKAQIAQAREQQLAKFQADTQAQRDKTQNDYAVANQSTQNNFTADQNNRELASRENIAAGNNATQLQAANISAGARTGAAGQRRETDKDIVGQPQVEKDENGDATGMYIVARRDGTMERVNPADLPTRGGALAPKDQKALDKKADAYAADRVDEIGSLFSSDKTSFKDYGGSKAAAKEQFKQEYMQKYAGTPAPDASSVPAPDAPAMASRKANVIPDNSYTAAPASAMSTGAQQLLQAARSANPGVSDDQLVQAMKANPDYAPYFK